MTIQKIKSMRSRQWLFVMLIALSVFACSKTGVEMFAGFAQPVKFPETVYHFNTNPVTQAGFELGKKLFYDTRLSRDNTVSCGFCHIQSAAFTHHGHNISHGIDDRLGKRNSQTLVNLAWSTSFFWDGGVFDLDLQPIVPITNPVEMDESVSSVLEKIRQVPEYPSLFRNAFGSEEINTERMMKALSQFMVMLVSDHSKYDAVQSGELTFTPDEERGYALFRDNCAGCHKEPLFTDHSFRNNGIAIGANKDEGRYAVTLKEDDRYRFKVPSLRNLRYTAPYMHDGRFITLEGVLKHYAEDVTPNADPLLHRNVGSGIALTNAEQQDIIAFLGTLNDSTFVNDKRFAEQQ